MIMDPTIWPVKGWWHSSECDLDFYPPLPLYIGPEPLTGTIAHPWALILILSSQCLDPSWDPAGTLELSGYQFCRRPPTDPQRNTKECLHQPNSVNISISQEKRKRQIVSVLTWFPAWTREKSSRLPLYQPSWWKAGYETLGWKQRTSFQERKSHGSKSVPTECSKRGLVCAERSTFCF